MEGEDGNGLLVLVTAVQARERRLAERLRSNTGFEVRPVRPTRLEAELTALTRERATDRSGSEPPDDGESTPRVRRPNGVVFELEQPAVLRDLLECVHEVSPELPTVVTPPDGSESLAAAAVRGDATEYVPSESDGAVDRIASTIRSVDRNGRPYREYHRILANELPDEAFLISEDGTYLEAKVRHDSADLYTTSADELTGHRIDDAFPDDVAATLQECIDRAIRTGEIQTIEYGAQTTKGQRRYEARVVPVDRRIDGQRAVVWLARDITERAKRERELRVRQAQLETLNRINAVVRQVIETLVEAPTRDAIERDVCAELVDSELYCGSWIAEQTGDGDLTYRTGAGEAETYLERVHEIDVDHERPIQRAARTGTIQTANRILETEPLPEPLQEAAREDDVRAAMAVPIAYEDATYGVLTVLAGREDAFSDSEQEGFDLLGETMGFSIMAVKNRQLLFADTVVELEFRIDGGETFSFDLSEEYDCTCSLEWAGTTVNGRHFQYVTIEGVDGETVLTKATDHESIEECRLIHDGTDRCTVEMRLHESGVRTLANHGATIRDVTVESGIGTCLVEVPQDSNIREIAEALSSVYERTELTARREVDRPVHTAAERRNRILDELTERQLTTLRLAYYGGFFDWPRESTGEEIADAMDVSPPTMHQHLRKGLKAVLSEFFERDSGTSGTGGPLE
ncbi:bacterio-opsin activator domain-containing protein [Halopiger djelfimassiliensis]|uniref:bacterio-opsin activator domain-containing protein n=1 Tax=Halopiger djelfimassiliensis TaxID=1293047 RepID=UPI0006781C9A|nr:bacterio-opsin activator domain-containing protein [Halopiger djelfimassiliensis]